MTLTLPLPKRFQRHKALNTLCEEDYNRCSETLTPCLFFDRRGVFVASMPAVFGVQIAGQGRGPKCPNLNLRKLDKSFRKVYN